MASSTHSPQDEDRPDSGPDAGPSADSDAKSSTERHSAKLPESHWARARDGTNTEALEYLRNRSKAPGVADGGSERNHYCLKCNGVLPLRYDSRKAAEKVPPKKCPHCGEPIEQRVRAMFNWVETDQVPGSDARAMAPLVVGLILIVAGAVWLAVRFLL
ncbi:hypothetical protein [Engelhardtia mirabilis]|uniref:Uncharacterized protein n=1 Tax=Engelhardtia mirabilis TaxID=2528011 RepID=A0A518BLD1_9BACT|nr:hypothetical protein Pla133_28660 [Planctomycetes bacterium Pla133]QDV02103.1 hypothetical protein Pla86_28650 [Planctomycetes bacterium Pla86]